MTLQEICAELGIARVTMTVTAMSDRDGEAYQLTGKGCNGCGPTLPEAVGNLRALLAENRRQAECDLGFARRQLAKAEARIAEIDAAK